MQGLLDYLITTGDSSTMRNNCPPCALFIPSMCPPRAPGVFDIGSSTQRNNDVLLRIGCKPTLGPHIRIQNQTSIVLLFVATYFFRFFSEVHSNVFSVLHPSLWTSIQRVGWPQIRQSTFLRIFSFAPFVFNLNTQSIDNQISARSQVVITMWDSN